MGKVRRSNSKIVAPLQLAVVDGACKAFRSGDPALKEKKVT